MNKHGWGIRVELAIILLFIICLIIATLGLSEFGLLKDSDSDSNIIINNSDTNDTFSYDTLESTLKESAKRYYNDYYPNGHTDTLIISKDTLVQNGYLVELKDGSDRNCSGYVKVTKNGVFVSYIDCPRYTTSGYDKDNE